MRTRHDPAVLLAAARELERRADALEADAATAAAEWDALVWRSPRADAVRAEVHAHRRSLRAAAADCRRAASELRATAERAHADPGVAADVSA